MARKFATPINMQQLEILGLRLEQRAGDPGSGVEGQAYWNTTTKRIRVYNGSVWVDLIVGPLAVTSADITDGAIMNVDINAAAAIALSKLATDPLARANHTGTQLAATISNFDTQVRTNRLDQMAAPTAAVAMGGQKITGLADGTAATDAVTKQQLDAAAAGLDVKASVRVASTGNINLASPGASIDGIALTAGDRVLLKNQTTASENGIYVWNGAASAMARAGDADASVEVTAGMFTFVEDGTQQDTGWVLATNNPIVVGTTGLVFTQFSGPGAVVAGAGLTQSGNTLSVANNGITNAMIVDGAVDLSTADVTGTLPLTKGGTGGTTAATARTGLAVPGRYDNGAVHGAGTTITIAAATHGLGAGRSKMVQIMEEATGDVIEADVNVAASGDVVVTSAAALAANAWRVLILGF